MAMQTLFRFYWTKTTIVKELRVRLPESKIVLLGIFPRGETNDPVRVQVKESIPRLRRLTLDVQSRHDPQHVMNFSDKSPSVTP